MSLTPGHDAASPTAGEAGVRVIRTGGRGLRTGLQLLALAALGLGVFLWLAPQRGSAPRVADTGAAPASVSLSTDATPMREAPMPRRQPLPAQSGSPLPQTDFTLPSLDPDDIAAYIDPNEPEPTMREVIEGLREAGIHDGLAAFNPPGTVPLMVGNAVPEDFPLPPGYVRHHQVTDEGEPLEPILMYSPDQPALDANGRPLPVPDDRVVPPDQLPPGLPVRPIELPAPIE
jgi:hypothetical protein